VNTAHVEPILRDLERAIVSNRTKDPESSYVARLSQGDENQMLKKVAEEAAELILAAKEGDRNALIHESADLVFHIMVVLANHGVPLNEVLVRLESRFGVSGLAEKSLRSATKSS